MTDEIRRKVRAAQASLTVARRHLYGTCSAYKLAETQPAVLRKRGDGARPSTVAYPHETVECVADSIETVRAALRRVAGPFGDNTDPQEDATGAEGGAGEPEVQSGWPDDPAMLKGKIDAMREEIAELREENQKLEAEAGRLRECVKTTFQRLAYIGERMQHEDWRGDDVRKSLQRAFDDCQIALEEHNHDDE